MDKTNELIYSLIEIIGRSEGYNVQYIRNIEIPCLSGHFSNNHREQGWYCLVLNIIDYLVSNGYITL